MPEKPNPRELRMVILFDPQDESCSICSHVAYSPDDCTACRAELAWLLASAGNPRALKRALTGHPFHYPQKPD
jgi:hypothetical protein